MKYLKIFENNNTEQVVLDAMNEYNRICNLIRDFINFEGLYPKQVNHVVRYYYEKNVNEIGDNILIAEFDEGEREYTGTMIDEELQERLYEFIKDPNLYKATKKYNI